MLALARPGFSLWVAEDHLLKVELNGCTESYKRFFFRDIQGLLIRETRRVAAASAVLAGCGALSFVGAVVVGGGGLWVFGALGCLSFALAMINWWQGPACECHVKTAVQTERLAGLDRVKRAQIAVDFLRPLIEGAQGVLTREEIERGAGELEVRSPTPPARRNKGSRRNASKKEAGPLKHCSGRFHRVLFWLLISDAVTTVVYLTIQHSLLTMIAGMMLAGQLICLAGALFTQHHSDLAASVKKVVWITGGVFLVSMGIAVIYMFAFYVSNPGFIDADREPTPGELGLPWIVIVIVSGVASLVLGIVGLRELNRWRSMPPGPPPLPNPPVSP